MINLSKQRQPNPTQTKKSNQITQSVGVCEELGNASKILRRLSEAFWIHRCLGRDGDLSDLDDLFACSVTSASLATLASCTLVAMPGAPNVASLLLRCILGSLGLNPRKYVCQENSEFEVFLDRASFTIRHCDETDSVDPSSVQDILNVKLHAMRREALRFPGSQGLC